MRHRTTRLALISLLVATASLTFAQTKPADASRKASADKEVADVARLYIRAARALDRDAMTKLYASTDNQKTKGAIDEAVWLAIEVERLRLAVEKKLGPQPADALDSEDWNWGVISESIFDAALKDEPTIVDVKDEEATVYIVGGLHLRRQAAGDWRIILSDEDAEPSDPALRAAFEGEMPKILADIESGKITSPSEVPSRLISIMEFGPPPTTQP